MTVSRRWNSIGRVAVRKLVQIDAVTALDELNVLSLRPVGGWNVTRAPVLPGEMLREEFMKPLGISGISADTALRLARYLGTGADFWMNLQKDYELLLARQKSLKTIEKQVRQRTVAA